MEKLNLPLVSVVIPTYNRIHSLPVSVSSVLNQTYRNLELIIIDDGSDDGTEEYVKGIADERVRYHRSDTNMGPSAARNMGARLAKGEYLAFQDSDDEWRADKLEKQLRLMLENGSLSFVYCELEVYCNDKLLAIVPSREISNAEKQGDLFSYLLLYSLISTQTMLLKTEEFLKEEGFNETLKAYEDFEFSLRFARNHKIGFVEEPLLKVNSSPNSVNKQFGERIRTQFYMVREMLGALREQKLLGDKLWIILCEAESHLCHDIFIEELSRLSEELLTREEQEGAAEFIKIIKQSKDNICLKAELRESLPRLKQRVIQIYLELYENRTAWTEELREKLKQIVGTVEAFVSHYEFSEEVKKLYALIQKGLETEDSTETAKLYLLADIVELFEMLEKQITA